MWFVCVYTILFSKMVVLFLSNSGIVPFSCLDIFWSMCQIESSYLECTNLVNI